MTSLSSDTPLEIVQKQFNILRRMPPWRKFALLDDLNETVRILAVSGLKQRHPGATPEQIKRMLADFMLGSELASKVYDHV
jgi:hypothetical protein